MKIRWTTEASSNLEQISLRIAEDKPEAARKTVGAIFERIEQLVSFPRRGRIGREEGTRELVLFPLPGHLYRGLAGHKGKGDAVRHVREVKALAPGVDND